jgi:putative ABC transport system ATP-binding protein
MQNITDPVISLEQVCKYFHRDGHAVAALEDVTLHLERERFTAVMGPSGSGKSTLMHIAAGLDDVTTGRVTIDGTVVTDLGDSQLTAVRRERLGFAFQSYNLVPTLDVAENIRLPFLFRGTSPTSEESAWIEHLVDRLGLAGRLGHRPHQLSGGQQQRAAIARALAGRPAVVFADEPTGALDSRSSRDVLGVLRDATTEWGQSVVMVTHDPVAASHADRLVFLADGRVVGDEARMSATQISTTMLDLEGAA